MRQREGNRDPHTLTLAERHLIRTPLCFLDETGTVGGSSDPFFAIGLVKATSAAGLTRMMRSWRDQHHYYEEIKFARLNKGLLPYYLDLLDGYCRLDDVNFSCFVLDKSPGWESRFGSVNRVYELLARQLLRGCCGRDEILTVIADEYSVGPTVRFEEQVTEWVNAKLGRLAVTQVVRVNSKGVDGIQVTDLLVGAIAYDCKVSAGLVASPGHPKKSFLDALRKRVGVASLAVPFRNERFNVAFHGREPFSAQK